jgi:cytochrome c553
MRASLEDKPRKLRWTDGARGSTLLPALRRALQIAGLGLSAMVSACAGAPEHPTWDDDVRPLMVARCIRCHSEPGQVDPLSAKTGLSMLDQPAAPSFDYVYFSDLVASPAKSFVASLPEFIRGKSPYTRMPPPPAAALEDWELQTLVNWTNDLIAKK